MNYGVIKKKKKITPMRVGLRLLQGVKFGHNFGHNSSTILLKMYLALKDSKNKCRTGRD